MTPTEVSLRPVQVADLDAFFQHQLDAQARWLAAFVTATPQDRARFDAHWARVLADATGCVRTVLAGGVVAGHVFTYMEDGRRELSYWLDKALWGRGIATRAVAAFIAAQAPAQVLHARVAKDNLASLKLLQRCGFQVCGEDAGFGAGRGGQVEEFLLQRPAGGTGR
jgi:RimJ/RimL family protein N-acetyltransferase